MFSINFIYRWMYISHVCSLVGVCLTWAGVNLGSAASVYSCSVNRLARVALFCVSPNLSGAKRPTGACCGE